MALIRAIFGLFFKTVVFNWGSSEPKSSVSACQGFQWWPVNI